MGQWAVRAMKHLQWGNESFLSGVAVSSSLPSIWRGRDWWRGHVPPAQTADRALAVRGAGTARVFSRPVRRSASATPDGHCRIWPIFIAPLGHCPTSLPHCLIASLPHCLIASLPHCLIAPLPHCPIAALPHCPIAPLPHCPTASMNRALLPENSYCLNARREL